MGINNSPILKAFVSRQMHLYNALKGDILQINLWIKTMILARHINVIDVQHEGNASLFHHGPIEFPLVHFTRRELHITGNIFKSERPPQTFLYISRPLGGIADEVAGIRRRQQIMMNMPVTSRPA
jgi:hypothetical protein